MLPKIASATTRSRWSGAAAPSSDLIRFGTAISIAAAFSAVQVFVIPRRLDLATYGQYRLFLVYVAYLELLNFGLVDGAFLRWAGRQPGAIAGEWRTIGRWLVGLQVAIVLVGVAAALMLAAPIARLYITAFALCAFFVNASVFSSYALQATGDFRRAGRIAMLAPGLFAVSVLLFPTHTLRGMLSSYVASYALAALYGASCVTTLSKAAEDESDLEAPPAFSALVESGAPVLGAGIAAGLARSADRILVSVFAPITQFALYGFASAVMVAAGVATQALSRVALSHAARRPQSERARFLDGFFDVIAGGFGIVLVGEPVFERMVAAWLPAYLGALPIVRALTIGLPIGVAIRVVLVGTLQSNAFVRRQLALELTGVGLVAAACGVCLVLRQPLWVVAAAAVAATVATFLGGMVVVRRAVPEAREQASLLFLLLVAAQATALLIAYQLSDSCIWRMSIYAILALAPTYCAVRRTLAHGL